MLKDVLAQNEIPVLSNSNIGAGMAMRAGAMFEHIKLHVRYDNLQRAIEIVNELLNASEVLEPDGNE